MKKCALGLVIVSSSWSGAAIAQAVNDSVVPVTAPSTPINSANPPDTPTAERAPTPVPTQPAMGSEEGVALPHPRAEQPNMNRKLSVFGALGYGFGYATGYGAAARYQFIIVSDGVLKMSPGKHDEIGIEAGFDLLHVGWSQNLGAGTDYSWSYNEFTPVAGIAWNIWLSDKIAVYPKIDLGYHIGSISATNGNQAVSTSGVAFNALYFHGTGGIIYDLGSVALRVEAGWATLRLGLSFQPF